MIVQARDDPLLPSAQTNSTSPNCFRSERRTSPGGHVIVAVLRAAHGETPPLEAVSALDVHREGLAVNNVHREVGLVPQQELARPRRKELFARHRQNKTPGVREASGGRNTNLRLKGSPTSCIQHSRLVGKVKRPRLSNKNVPVSVCECSIMLPSHVLLLPLYLLWAVHVIATDCRASYIPTSVFAVRINFSAPSDSPTVSDSTCLISYPPKTKKL